MVVTTFIVIVCVVYAHLSIAGLCLGINSVHTYASRKCIQRPSTSGTQDMGSPWKLVGNWNPPSIVNPMTDTSLDTRYSSPHGTLLRADLPTPFNSVPAARALSITTVPRVPTSTVSPFILSPTLPSLCTNSTSLPVSATTTSTFLPSFISSSSPTNKREVMQLTQAAAEQRRYLQLARLSLSPMLTTSWKRCISIHPEVLHATPLYQSRLQSPEAFREDAIECIDMLAVPGSWFQIQQLLRAKHPRAPSIDDRDTNSTSSMSRAKDVEDIPVENGVMVSAPVGACSTSQPNPTTSHALSSILPGKQASQNTPFSLVRLQSSTTSLSHLPQTAPLSVACILVNPQTLVSPSTPFPVIFGSPLTGYRLLNTPSHPLLIAGSTNSNHPVCPSSAAKPAATITVPRSGSAQQGQSHPYFVLPGGSYGAAPVSLATSHVRQYNGTKDTSSDSDTTTRSPTRRNLKRQCSNSPARNCSPATGGNLVHPPRAKRHKRSSSLLALSLSSPTSDTSLTRGGSHTALLRLRRSQSLQELRCSYGLQFHASSSHDRTAGEVVGPLLNMNVSESREEEEEEEEEEGRGEWNSSDTLSGSAMSDTHCASEGGAAAIAGVGSSSNASNSRLFSQVSECKL